MDSDLSSIIGRLTDFFLYRNQSSQQTASYTRPVWYRTGSRPRRPLTAISPMSGAYRFAAPGRFGSRTTARGSRQLHDRNLD
jgi:hypothetical protein